MNQPDPADTPNLTTRVTRLEELFTHQQQVIAELNEVIIDQAARLDQMRLRIERLEGKLDGLQDQIAEQRNLEDEKPPHY